MRRSIVSAILFVVAGIFYLIAAMKGNIPIYYIFSILLLLFGGVYIKRSLTEKKVEEESKIKNSKPKNNKLKTVDIKNIKVNEVKKDTNKEKKSNSKSSKQK